MTDKFVKYKVFLWIVAILITLNLLTLALIWFGKPAKDGKRPPPPPEFLAGFFKNELGWNEAQTQKFDYLGKKYFQESKILIDSVLTFRKELFKLVAEGDSSNQNALLTAEKIGQLQTRIDMQRYEHFKEIENICDTEEQKKKFNEILMDVFLPMPVPEGMRPPFPKR